MAILYQKLMGKIQIKNFGKNHIYSTKKAVPGINIFEICRPDPVNDYHP